MQFKDRIYLFAFDTFTRSFQKRDILAAERLGSRLTLLVRFFDSKHRKRTDENLRLAFPNWTPEKRLETGLEMYRHFGRIVADFMKTPQRTDANVIETTEVEGLENLEAAEALNLGIIAVTGHFGNWERMSHWMKATGRPITVIARDANQGVLNEKVQKMRESVDVKVVSRGAAARKILTTLKNKELVGILPDQNTDEIFITFFQKPCGSVTGPAAFHLKTGAPILPCYGVWTGPGKYKLIIKPALKPVPGLPEAEGFMQAVADSLEEMVREYPSQWLWMHDRWKSARLAGMI